jgi:hypothetical protein
MPFKSLATQGRLFNCLSGQERWEGCSFLLQIGSSHIRTENFLEA